jgi:hypothetical protein
MSTNGGLTSVLDSRELFNVLTNSRGFRGVAARLQLELVTVISSDIGTVPEENLWRAPAAPQPRVGIVV